MNLRMNMHRKGKSGCEIVINHFTHVCPGAKFSIQVLEKLPGDGYKNGFIEIRRCIGIVSFREDFWMKKLQTI